MFLILQKTWHWPEWQGSRQVGFSQVHWVHSPILVCVQRALTVPSSGQAASQRFVLPIPNSSGLSQEHAAIKAPASAVSCWHSRRDSASSSHPRLQAAHVLQHPIAPIPPGATKLTCQYFSQSARSCPHFSKSYSSSYQPLSKGSLSQSANHKIHNKKLSQ